MPEPSPFAPIVSAGLVSAEIRVPEQLRDLLPVTVVRVPGTSWMLPVKVYAVFGAIELP